MTHTPGPWVVKFNTDNQTAAIEPSKELLAQGRGGIAHIYSKNPLDEGYANQRLIAAAPDLLAALELFDRKRDKLIRRIKTGNRNDIGWALKILDEMDSEIQAAIAKARGE
jgi:hypothetical protein